MSTHDFLKFKEHCVDNDIVIVDENFLGCFSRGLRFKLRCSKGHEYNKSVNDFKCDECKKDAKIVESIKREDEHKEMLRILRKAINYKIGDLCMLTFPCQHNMAITCLENCDCELDEGWECDCDNEVDINERMGGDMILYMLKNMEKAVESGCDIILDYKSLEDIQKDIKHFDNIINRVPMDEVHTQYTFLKEFYPFAIWYD
jgi:hypothetical protein